MQYIAAALMMLLSVTAATAQALHETSDGQTYQMTDNEHGYVLSAPGETIYLGKSCDAFSTTAGAGFWEWANGGFCVNLAEKSICFPRKDVGAGQIDHDISACMM